MAMLAWLDGLGQLAGLIVWWIGMMALMSLGLVAIIAGSIAERFDRRLSNCFLHVVRRFRADDGYVIVQRSLFVPGCLHFGWSKDLVTMEAFNPPRKVSRAIPPLLFRGTREEILMATHAKHDEHVKKVQAAVAAASGTEAKVMAAATQTAANFKEIVSDLADEAVQDLAANLKTLLK